MNIPLFKVFMSKDVLKDKYDKLTMSDLLTGIFSDYYDTPEDNKKLSVYIKILNRFVKEKGMKANQLSVGIFPFL